MKTTIAACFLFSATLAFAQQQPTDSTKSKELETIVIQKKNLQQKADRLIFDVASNPVAKGNTAFQLLKQTPLLSSTDDKTLKIAGKTGAVIYLDSRRTQMDADALEAFLKNTPAENIAKIEVISSPGSEYNVESGVGVINIILKKKMSDGVNGNLRMSNSQDKNNSQRASASINFRRGALGGSANLSTSHDTNQQQMQLSNGLPNNYNLSDGKIIGEDWDTGGYLNLDYTLSPKHSLGLNYNIWHSKSPQLYTYFFNTYRSITAQQTAESYSVSENTGRNNSLNNSLNLNYLWKMDDQGSKIDLNAAYLHYTKEDATTSLTNMTDAQGNMLSRLTSFEQQAPQTIRSYYGTLDITKVLKGVSLGLGGNFSDTHTDNDTRFQRWNAATGQMNPDTAQSNHFIYDEKIGGVYVNAEKSFGEKISAKVGARYEFTNSTGDILGKNVHVDRSFRNLLPFGNFSYAINENHNLSYSFSSRVRRPSFWELNPVRLYLTETNYVQNNPFIKATTSYSHELMYMLKSAYFLNATYTKNRDASTQIPLQKEVNGVNVLRYIRTNYGTESQLAVNIGMNKNFFDGIWNTNTILGMQHNIYRGSVDTDPITNEKFPTFIMDESRTSPFFQTSNTIRLSSKKDWFFGVNYFYLGKSRIELGTLNAIQSVDLSLKKIWNSWTFMLEVNDIFASRRPTITDEQPSGYFNSLAQYQYSRRAVLSLTYNFGNQKIQRARKIGAESDIKSRTGQ